MLIGKYSSSAHELLLHLLSVFGRGGAHGASGCVRLVVPGRPARGTPRAGGRPPAPRSVVPSEGPGDAGRARDRSGSGAGALPSPAPVWTDRVPGRRPGPPPSAARAGSPSPDNPRRCGPALRTWRPRRSCVGGSDGRRPVYPAGEHARRTGSLGAPNRQSWCAEPAVLVRRTGSRGRPTGRFPMVCRVSAASHDVRIVVSGETPACHGVHPPPAPPCLHGPASRAPHERAPRAGGAIRRLAGQPATPARRLGVARQAGVRRSGCRCAIR
jgi:hypothetical protein